MIEILVDGVIHIMCNNCGYIHLPHKTIESGYPTACAENKIELSKLGGVFEEE